MKDPFEGKTVLLTGGTGSFGQKFVDIVLSEYKPDSVRIYSRGELKQVEMERRFEDERLRFLIGDIRDRARLYRAMNGVDIVIHAAALKHVPVCEYNPIEAIRTNIDGAGNIIDAAIDNSVEKVIALSTDKAAQPVNLYGATKLVSEKMFIQGNAYAGGKKSIFSCVRYGNVVGSRGSVIPIFVKQKELGTLTITDEEMTRFWITLEQGVRFVINSLDNSRGGEIFVPKIPSTKITDLADVIAPDAKKKIVGIRPGEKLHEILLTSDEAKHSLEFSDQFIIVPKHSFWDDVGKLEGRELDGGFEYASNTNNWKLTKEEMKKMLVMEGWIQE